MDSRISAAQEEHRSRFQSCPAPALALPQPPGSSTAEIHIGTARCFPQLDSSCRALPHPLLLPVALPLLLETGLAWRGKQMLHMVGIFPASVRAGDGRSRSAELGALWVQPCLRRPPGLPLGSSQPREAGRGGFGQGDGSACARHPGCVSCCTSCLPGPSLRATLPRLPRGISGFPLLCRASVPPSALL